MSWTRAGLLLTEPLGTNFSEILINDTTHQWISSWYNMPIMQFRHPWWNPLIMLPWYHWYNPSVNVIMIQPFNDVISASVIHPYSESHHCSIPELCSLCVSYTIYHRIRDTTPQWMSSWCYLSFSYAIHQWISSWHNPSLSCHHLWYNPPVNLTMKQHLDISAPVIQPLTKFHHEPTPQWCNQNNPGWGILTKQKSHHMVVSVPN